MCLAGQLQNKMQQSLLQCVVLLLLRLGSLTLVFPALQLPSHTVGDKSFLWNVSPLETSIGWT